MAGETGIAAAQAELGDRYRVLHVLGEGGGGETFEAVSPVDGRHVALKRLVVTHARDWKTVELFEREARVLGGLDHPGIPKLRESFVIESPGTTSLYLAHDLAPGMSLGAWLARGWRPDPNEVFRIAQLLLDVLAYLHSLSPPVVHRDIKPDNVIRSEDGRLWLVDFGAVRDFTTTISGGSTVVGTYGYMAPEQFRGHAVPASDIYAVGATLLHLFTGRAPTDLPQEKLKVVFRPYVQAPPLLLAWLDRALEPSPEDRFVTAIAAMHALHGRIETQRGGTSARGPGGAKRSSPARLAMLLALFGVTLAGGAIFVGVTEWRERRSLVKAPHVLAIFERLPERPPGPHQALRLQQTFQAHASLLTAIAVSPDDKVLATGSDGSVKLWDVEHGDLLRTLGGHDGKVGSVAFTQDSKELVTAGGSSIRIWDTAKGTLTRTIDHPHGARVWRAVLAPDEKTLYSIGLEGVAKAWDFQTGRALRSFAHGSQISALAAASNGVWIATGGADGNIKLWNAQTGGQKTSWHAHGAAIGDLAFGPDGTLLASAGDDHRAQLALLRPDGELLARNSITFGDEAWGVAFSPDGQKVAAVGKDGWLKVVDGLDGEPVAALQTASYATDAAFTHDNRTLFVSTGAFVQRYSVAFKRSGTKLPEPSPSASSEPPPARSPEHGLYLEAMRLTMLWPSVRLEDAEAKLAEAMKINPRSQVVRVGYAQIELKRAYLNGADYDPKGIAAAQRHLDYAATLGEKGVEWWAMRAWVARGQKNIPAARDAVRMAHALVPDEPYASLCEAKLDIGEERLGSAVAIVNRLIASTRRREMLQWGYGLLSEAYVELGDIDAADAAHRKLIELDPRHPWYRGNYASFLLWTANDPDRAIEEAERARAIMNYGNARSTLAAAHVERGNRFLWHETNPDRADREFDAAIALRDSLDEAYYGRAAGNRLRAIDLHDPKLVAKVRADLALARKADPTNTLVQKALDEVDSVEVTAKAGGPVR